MTVQLLVPTHACVVHKYPYEQARVPPATVQVASILSAGQPSESIG